MIKSAIDGKILRFHDVCSDYFQVTVEGDGPRATKKIWGYTDSSLIADLFESCARDWKGWNDVRHWESIEGDLRLEVSASWRGQVTIRVHIRDFGESADWRLEVPIFTEAGALERISSQCRSFFG